MALRSNASGEVFTIQPASESKLIGQHKRAPVEPVLKAKVLRGLLFWFNARRPDNQAR